MQMRLEQRPSLWLTIVLILRRLAYNLADILRNSPIELAELVMVIPVAIWSAGIMQPGDSFTASADLVGNVLNSRTEFWWGLIGCCIALYKLVAVCSDVESRFRPFLRQSASACMFLFWLATGWQFYRISTSAPGFYWSLGLVTVQCLLFLRQSAIHAPKKIRRSRAD